MIPSCIPTIDSLCTPTIGAIVLFQNSKIKHLPSFFANIKIIEKVVCCIPSCSKSLNYATSNPCCFWTYIMKAFISQNKPTTTNFEYHKRGLTEKRKHKKKKAPLLKKWKKVSCSFFSLLELIKKYKKFGPHQPYPTPTITTTKMTTN